jgi:hypothetical protein
MQCSNTRPILPTPPAACGSADPAGTPVREREPLRRRQSVAGDARVKWRQTAAGGRQKRVRTPAAGGPPVLHVAFLKLMTRGQRYLFTRDGRTAVTSAIIRN